MSIPDYVSRVIQEKEELDERISKLRLFISTTTFAALPAEDQRLLGQQAMLMCDLSHILSERVERFEEAKKTISFYNAAEGV